jgi:uncharacterized protein (TIGR03435 family)
MGRPVIDKTGFTGAFDVQVKFMPDQSTAGLMVPGGLSSQPTDSNFPGILAAIQEQLGVKLESAKGPVEVLVIDHVEHPSEN